jgi:ActD protein
MSGRRIDVAVFASEDGILRAARACRDHGLEIVDARSPHPIHGFDDIAGIRRSRLPLATLVAGIAGLALGTWLQLWTSARDWAIDVGGKPWNSMPAFLPVTFELTVLCAGLTTVAVLLVRSRLRPGRAPALEGLHTTDDRYALLVASPMGAHTAGEMGRLWSELGAESWSCREGVR